MVDSKENYKFDLGVKGLSRQRYCVREGTSKRTQHSKSDSAQTPGPVKFTNHIATIPYINNKLYINKCFIYIALFLSPSNSASQ